MNADVKGALAYMKKSKYGSAFTHRGKFLSKANAIKVLEYADRKGYKTTSELTDKEVDDILGWTFEIHL